jgi:hypothetical protein
MVGGELVQNLLGIKAILRVALPGIDASTSRGKFQFVDGLAEGAVRIAGEDSKLDDCRWTKHLDQAPGKRDVTDPCGEAGEHFGAMEDERIIERIKGSRLRLKCIGIWAVLTLHEALPL